MSASAQQSKGDSFKSKTIVVGQTATAEDVPMEVDSENPIPNLNSQSDSGSREGVEGAIQQDTAGADMVVQAQEALLKSKSLFLSLAHSVSLSFYSFPYPILHLPRPLFAA